MAGSGANRFWMRLSLIVGAVVGLMAFSAPAHAATIHVTAGAGDGVAADSTCSLREAINAANDDSLSAAGGCDNAGQPGPVTDVIEVPAGTYDLAAGGGGDDDNASGDLDAQGRVEIDGPGAAAASISGSGDRVLDVAPGAAVRVVGLTIKDGTTLNGASAANPGGDGGPATHGGGIRNAGFLVLDGCVVTHNSTGDGGNAAAGDQGGLGGQAGRGAGIYSTGRLTLLRTSVDHNTTGDGGDGGQSTVTGPSGTGGPGGQGAGVHSAAGVTLLDSDVADNAAGAGGRGGPEGPSFIDAGNGGIGGSGGGLFVGNSQLTITDSTVRNNQAGAGGDAGNGTTSPGDGGQAGFGGGVLAGDTTSTFTLTRSTISGNTTSAGGRGTSVNANVGGNGGDGGWGAGVAANGVAADVKSSTITANVTGAGGRGGDGNFRGGDGGNAGFGGGVLLETAGATITETTIGDNRGGLGGESGDGSLGGTGGIGGAGGGVLSLPPGTSYDGGTLTITSSTFSGNAAGDTHATKSSTIAGDLTNPPNDGPPGGALAVVSGKTTVVNSTFSGNSAGRGGDLPAGANGTNDPPAGDGGGGGAIYSGVPLEIRNSTLASNSVGSPGTGATNGTPATSGGIEVVLGTTTVRNTLIASNTGGNCFGTFDDGGHNIDFPNSACPGTDADPKLGPLQDNGGPTFTRAIGADGAAFDQVPATGAGCPAVDQRGQGRPKGAACDIGAFELDPPAGGQQQGGQQQEHGTQQQGGNGDGVGTAGGTPGVVTPGDQPAGGGTTPVKLAIKLLLRGQRLGTALSKGYGARFDTNEASTAVLEVFVEGSATRGLKPAARKRVRVARGSRKLSASGRGTVTAKFTRKARRALGRRKSVKVLVRLTVTDGAGAKSVTSKRVTLKR